MQVQIRSSKNEKDIRTNDTGTLFSTSAVKMSHTTCTAFVHNEVFFAEEPYENGVTTRPVSVVISKGWSDK
jgi:hypothetical protein